MKRIIFTSCACLFLTSCKTLDYGSLSGPDYSSCSDQVRTNQQQQTENNQRRRNIEANQRISELENQLRRERNASEMRIIQAQIDRQRQDLAQAQARYQAQTRAEAETARQRARQAQENLERQRLENQRLQREAQANRAQGYMHRAEPPRQPAAAHINNEDRDFQQATDNSLITFEQEERRREEERRRRPNLPAAQQASAQAHPAPHIQPVPQAQAAQPAPVQAQQNNAADVDGRSWFEAGEIVKEYRQDNGGRSPRVSHIVSELQRRVGISNAQARHVCDEMGLVDP